MEKLKIILFSVLITVLLTASVSYIRFWLNDRIELNSRVQQQKIILGLLEVNIPEAASAYDISELYVKQVSETESNSVSGLYYFSLTDQPNRFVIPFAGSGFWGPINGYLAADISEKVIGGINFASHSETPGLGGRIEEDWFRDQFSSVPIINGDQAAEIRLSKKSRTNQFELDAITGATETSRAVERIINQGLQNLLAVSREIGGVSI